jgi:hypothetical protein
MMRPRNPRGALYWARMDGYGRGNTMTRRCGIAAIVLGVIAQFAGLALDSVLHARDATLAEREGVLSLDNPGHLLFAAGLALTVAGVCTLLLGPSFVGGRRRTPAMMALAALPVAAMLAASGGAFVVAARTGGLTGHVHTQTEAAHQPKEPASASAGGAPDAAHDHGGRAPTAVVKTDGSRHQHGEEINVSWQQLKEIDAILTTAKAATEKYRDVSLARADGYVQVTQVVPGIGAHFVQPALLAAGVFDPARPAILLYDRAPGGDFELVGVSWNLPKKPGDDTPPDSPFGPLAVWHYHTDLCFGGRGGAPVVTTTTPAGCRAAGGLFVKETGWMLHAWIFRDSPEGVFSHQNSTIKGGAPLTARR